MRQPRTPKSSSLWRKKKAPRFWKADGMAEQGCVLALTGKASDAIQMITSGISGIAVNGSNNLDAVDCSHIWRAPMRSSGNSMTLGAASAKR